MYECDKCGSDVDTQNGVITDADDGYWLCCPSCGAKIINLVKCDGCGSLVVDDGCSYAHLSVFGYKNIRHWIVCEQCQRKARKSIAMAANGLTAPLYEYMKQAGGLRSIVSEFEDELAEVL